MLRIVLFAVLALLITACASREYEPWLTRGVNPGPSSEVRDLFTFERTACFGFCPVYKVTVDERDIMEFRGERFVAEEGGAVGKHLPDGSYKKLAEIARAHGFGQFDAAYPNEDGSNCPRRSTDSPSVILAFKDGSQSRKVSVYEGCADFDGRARFEAMVAAMEEVLDIDDLVGPREAFTGENESDKE